MKRHAITICCVLAALLCTALPLAAQGLSVDIYGPGQRQLNFAQTAPLPLKAGQSLPALAQSLQARIQHNLMYMPFLKQMMDNDVLGGMTTAGVTGDKIDFKRFQLSRADLIMTSGWTSTGAEGGDVELRVYESLSGQLLVGKGYSDVKPMNIPDVADRFCAELMRVLTGQGEFFLSEIGYSKKEGNNSNIWLVHSTGHDTQRLTNLDGINEGEGFSFNGKQMAFTHIGMTGHELGVWTEGEGTKLVKLKGSTVIGPTFLPDGQIALSLSFSGTSSIYLLDRDYNIVKPLAQSWGIDVSPCFDAGDKTMVFTSSRDGNPHIFKMDVATGQVSRVTYDGKYNTGPSISPDGRLLVFARLTPQGQRIWLHDMQTGAERQISDGPGDDEDPSFAPDGYYVAFASSRTGEWKIYLTTRHGDPAIPVDTGPGSATSPAWRYKR
ncbi:WD40-like beta Propeller containing protein [Desulfovibrio sp. X2]|uniref:PD40 domain-containing protein n=1 Tax=Desulfovibrio sp. X2 TaxID=941449 RepID=UPI0003589475|nr:PD40 domain-containing protein [Desulfovibrio sp. X2]EPR37044.1 WD40-like beta Propeller containing protein [Desulfovibrio sp. X2]